MVGIEKGFRRYLFDHLSQFPSQIHRILHTGLEALPAVRGMHVCGVAGQQDPPLAVGLGLPGRVGKPGDPSERVDAVICPAHGDERLAEIAKGGFGRGAYTVFPIRGCFADWIKSIVLAYFNRLLDALPSRPDSFNSLTNLQKTICLGRLFNWRCGRVTLRPSASVRNICCAYQDGSVRFNLAIEIFTLCEFLNGGTIFPEYFELVPIVAVNMVIQRFLADHTSD